MELVDVYGFGHVLYEMIYGQALVVGNGARADFNDCPHRELKPVLDSILVEDVLSKSGPPTIAQLLEMPVFKSTNIDTSLPSSSSAAAAISSSTNAKLFTSSKVKENLLKNREHVERRLNEEQKLLHRSKRQSQAESKVLSEEEVRKRRREKKVVVSFFQLLILTSNLTRKLRRMASTRSNSRLVSSNYFYLIQIL